MRVLISGGRGQLGRALETALGGQPVFVLGHDDMDITDATAVSTAIGERRPDVVINAAAWTDTAGCEREPEQAMRVNGAAPGIVAEACKRHGAAMVQVSSNEVFDGEKGAPYAEDDRTHAINEYARSKLYGERRVMAALGRHFTVRTSWLYGPGRLSFPEKIVAAARQHGSLKLVTDEVASPTWTVDLAQAIARLIETEAYGVYHLTNSGWCSRLEWAQEVLRLAGMAGVPVEPTTLAEFGAPYRKPPFTALDNNNAARLGITLRPWQQALREHFQHPDSEVRELSFPGRTGSNQ